MVQFGKYRRVPVPSIPRHSVSGHCLNDAGGCNHSTDRYHHLDPAISGIGYVKSTTQVDGDTYGLTQFCSDSEATVTGIPSCPIASDGYNRSANREHLSDRVIAGVRDVEIPRTVDRDTFGIAQTGVR